MWHADKRVRSDVASPSPPRDAGGAIAGTKRFIAAHPWTTALVLATLVVIFLTIAHITRGQQPPAVAVQQTLPAGAAMPTIVAVKDEKSGCTVRLYYDGERLVSVLPALRKGGEPDCPDA